MENDTIAVKYNGKRFPRTVALRGGGKLCFQPYCKVLELDEYDALLLLKANTRMTPNKFEFTVADIMTEESVDDAFGDKDTEEESSPETDEKDKDMEGEKLVQKPAKRRRGMHIKKSKNK